MKIDLHCHTKISDNSFTIEEVLWQAKRNDVTHLAITDHDTTAGLEYAMQFGEKIGVTIIPGIEISAYDYKRNTRAHILGLFITPGHPAISKLCQPFLEKRNEVSYLMVEQLIKNGYDLSWEEVQSYAEGGTSVFKQHIMHALLDKGYTNRIYGDLYKKLFIRGNAIKEPGIAYVPLEYVDAIEAIRVIREANGIPVLAHPGQFNNFDAAREWAKMGLEGIEVKHPLHNVADEIKAKEIAEQYNLIQTGGSDFHGFYGDAEVPLGTFNLGEDCLELLLKRKIELSHP
ncbi:PHP domain-containing protein [Bacillus sp. PS06]|uniref:PHP domain-containing protein n=1 Tax=Bacillus sp. PS06 TaxID=2764176 RepID=UPI00178523D3|nr:PHP domain-containing protein [Bacillus sp. PS06]MBD8067899.1 PHP domain-containing protein [Bacillus sp. PS06]